MSKEVKLYSRYSCLKHLQINIATFICLIGNSNMIVNNGIFTSYLKFLHSYRRNNVFKFLIMIPFWEYLIHNYWWYLLHIIFEFFTCGAFNFVAKFEYFFSTYEFVLSKISCSMHHIDYQHCAPFIDIGS